MQSRTLIVLAGLVVVLAIFILFIERDLPSTDERSEQADKVLRLERDQIQRLTLDWDDRRTVLERGQPPTVSAAEENPSEPAPSGQWRVVEPMVARAEPAKISTLLDTLLELRKERTLEDLDRSDAGLETPRGRLAIRTGATGEGAADELVLELGPEVPASSALLAAISGQPEIYQVSDSLIAELQRPAGDWRDPNILGLERAAIDRLQLERQGNVVTLARHGEELGSNNFWIEAPLEDRADVDAVAELLAAVVGLRAERFLDRTSLDRATPEEAPGFSEPTEILEIGTVTGASYRVAFGARTESGNRRARLLTGNDDSAPLTFETSIVLDPSFDRSVADWRSKTWSRLESYQITGFELRDSTGVLTFELRQGNWHRGEEALDYGLVSDFLLAVTEARAEFLLDREVATGEHLATGTPVLSLELIGRDLAPQSLSLYPPGLEEAAASDAERPTILVLDPGTAGKILEGAAGLRQAAPMESTEEESTAGENSDGS